MKTSIILLTLALSSCQQLQFLGYRPNIRYSAATHYKAQVMASGTRAHTIERAQYIHANRPPRSNAKKITEALSWPDLETAGKMPPPTKNALTQ